MKGPFLRVISISGLGVGCLLAAPAASEFQSLGESYKKKIRPLVDRYCLDCHDKATSEGELDLERFNDLTAVRRDPKTWQHVVEQLENGEMPPKKKESTKQPSTAERAALIAWTKSYLNTEARAQAGDPGPVVLRRLSNSEYTYSVRDLTGVASLKPAHEFPVDSAAGEGFTNAGGALVMSPALFEKYLEAGKQIAAHVVLLPEGFRFSPSTTRADHANELLAELRASYLRTTGGEGINFSYTSQVRNAAPEGEGEGRLNLTPYLASLIKHHARLREDPGQAARIAVDSGLNAKYFGILTFALVAGEPKNSFLLDHLRNKLSRAKPNDAAAIATEVRSWQDRLWKFNKVGHLGLVRPWQEPVTAIATARDIRIKLGPDTKRIYLSAQGFGGGKATVEWQKPRIERPGRTPILLRDLEAGFAKLKDLHRTALDNTARYLAVAAEVRKAGKAADTTAIAARHKLDPGVLNAWASYLGLSHGGKVEIRQHLTARIPTTGGYNFVTGWGLKGVGDYSLLGNSSDQDVRIPGDMKAHKVVVHPRPDRWIAAGWMSPFDGRVKVSPHVRDAHGACGNGVSWSVDLRRGSLARILRSADLDLGQVAAIEPVNELEVRKGDLISVIIGARDNNHSCDLTEIDLAIEELGPKARLWSLSGNCADNMHAGNPHSDHLGNQAIWHFYGGLNDRRKRQAGAVPGSLLAAWLHEKDATRAGELADRVQTLLSNPLPPDASEPDKMVHQALTSLAGPLFARLDFAELAQRNQSEAWKAYDVNGNRLMNAPSHLEFDLPQSLVAGAHFVVRGVVHESSDPNIVMQFHAGTSEPAATASLRANEPIVVHSRGAAREKMENALAEFRNLFPAAMCYARVVPADEVVTMLLYHREDDHLARLMLSVEERARIDRLWRQLEFVKLEPRRLVTSYEQIWQFSTQDADPKKFEPMEAAIRKRAAEFEKTLLAAEPTHLDALVAFAPKVYRRPLTKDEGEKLRRLYHQLRREKLSHEEALRLTLARLFTAAAFLYKTEAPPPGPKQGAVSNWELATRLSYFLTSSAPDAELRRVAAAGTLTNDKTLGHQTQRLLKGDRARRLAIEFACQWLHIRDFDQLDEKNERLYPEFTKLRGSMYEESIRFFTDFFRNNRSILSLLEADHVFVDAELARFYDLPEPAAGWHRVGDTKKSGRGGILGFATTLARQSGASRTSPILRGNWVSETLLGERLPKPPKDVPQLPDTVPEGLSERELIARHSSDPACAKCHDRIDPYGFALESYNAIGRRRTVADTKAKLPDGKSIDGLDGLRTYLLNDRRETFLRHFCQKLLGYALGREVQLSDEPLLDEIMKELPQNDYRIGIAVEAIVQSPQFREIRGAQHP